jgi:hypothetical protein
MHIAKTGQYGIFGNTIFGRNEIKINLRAITFDEGNRILQHSNSLLWQIRICDPHRAQKMPCPSARQTCKSAQVAPPSFFHMQLSCRYLRICLKILCILSFQAFHVNARSEYLHIISLDSMHAKRKENKSPSPLPEQQEYALSFVSGA